MWYFITGFLIGYTLGNYLTWRRMQAEFARFEEELSLIKARLHQYLNNLQNRPAFQH